MQQPRQPGQQPAQQPGQHPGFFDRAGPFPLGQIARHVGAALVHADDEIMLITDKGVLVRTRVSEIRELGRATQGVTLIALDEGSQLSGLQRIVENDANVADIDADGENSGDGGSSAAADAPEAPDA